MGKGLDHSIVHKGIVYALNQFRKNPTGSDLQHTGVLQVYGILVPINHMHFPLMDMLMRVP
jgi:hypothetical protein